MMRFVVMGMLLAFLPGCRQESASDLSPSQKARWQRFRKELADPYLVAGYLKDLKEWRICVYDRMYYKNNWEMKFDYWSQEEKDTADHWCKKTAGDDPKVAAMALIDLRSRDAPFVVWWYTADNGKVTRSNKPPKKDLDESMRSFLRLMQTDVDGMTP